MLVIAVSHSKKFTTFGSTDHDIVSKEAAMEFICNEHCLNEDDVDEIMIVDNNLFIRTIPVGEMAFTMLEDISAFAEMEI